MLQPLPQLLLVVAIKHVMHTLHHLLARLTLQQKNSLFLQLALMVQLLLAGQIQTAQEH